MEARYDTIGLGYAGTRREDPGIRSRLNEALGEARTVVNVGAGAGSYEPSDRHVIAIEPSDVMAAQRPRTRAPALRGTAPGRPRVILPARPGSGRGALPRYPLQCVWSVRRSDPVPERTGKAPDARNRAAEPSICWIGPI